MLPDGTVYVADRMNKRVVRWSRGASAGVVVAANFTNQVVDVWVLDDGFDENERNILVAESGSQNNDIRVFLLKEGETQSRQILSDTNNGLCQGTEIRGIFPTYRPWSTTDHVVMS